MTEAALNFHPGTSPPTYQDIVVTVQLGTDVLPNRETGSGVLPEVIPFIIISDVVSLYQTLSRLGFDVSSNQYIVRMLGIMVRTSQVHSGSDFLP